MPVTKLSPNLKFLLSQRSPSPPPLNNAHKLDKACRTTLRNLQDAVQSEDGTLKSWLVVAVSSLAVFELYISTYSVDVDNTQCQHRSNFGNVAAL